MCWLNTQGYDYSYHLYTEVDQMRKKFIAKIKKSRQAEQTNIEIARKREEERLRE